MPTLTLRSVGMSHILEGFPAAGIDGRGMLDALAESYGPAASPLSSGQAPGSEGVVVEGIIIDRKAASWGVLRDWVEVWFRDRGCLYVSWADDAQTPGTAATLHFHP